MVTFLKETTECCSYCRRSHAVEIENLGVGDDGKPGLVVLFDPFLLGASMPSFLPRFWFHSPLLAQVVIVGGVDDDDGVRRDSVSKDLLYHYW